MKSVGSFQQGLAPFIMNLPVFNKDCCTYPPLNQSWFLGINTRRILQAGCGKIQEPVKPHLSYTLIFLP